MMKRDIVAYGLFVVLMILSIVAQGSTYLRTVNTNRWDTERHWTVQDAHPPGHFDHYDNIDVSNNGPLVVAQAAVAASPDAIDVAAIGICKVGEGDGFHVHPIYTKPQPKMLGVPDQPAHVINRHADPGFENCLVALKIHEQRLKAKQDADESSTPDLKALNDAIKAVP